jgi:hypothetical protein
MEEPVKIYVHETSALELDAKIPYSIEYFRKDTFIEKVLKFLDENFFFNNKRHSIESGMFDSKEEMFEDFKKYIEE